MTVQPEGVIARYLSVGGATVEVRGTDTATHTSTCTGCTSHEFHQNLDRHVDDDAAKRTLADARRWAQIHAETCRAMPLPGAGN